MLLDLLSIGAPPDQNNTSTLDILSSNQDKQSSGDLLATLPISSLSVQASSPAGSSSMMDLLDGFGASPSLPGMYNNWMSAFITMFLVKFSLHHF